MASEVELESPLFGRLSDEEMLAILTKLSEQEQFSCRGVDRRWRSLAQDPQLTRHAVQEWKAIKDLFNLNHSKFVEALDRLRDCLRATDDVELHELADDKDALLAMPKKIKKYRVVEAIDELIAAYDKNCTSTYEQQVRTMTQRQQLRQQISDRTVKLWGHIKNDEQVHVVDCNPFGLPVPVKAWMLEPLNKIIKELAIPDEVFPEVVEREEDQDGVVPIG